MTTETAPDPVVHDWSNDLEAELAEAGMEPPQAKVFARAFELGMMRVMSVVATKQDLEKAIAGLRSEMRFLFLFFGALMTALLSALLAIVA